MDKQTKNDQLLSLEVTVTLRLIIIQKCKSYHTLASSTCRYNQKIHTKYRQHT